MDQQASLRKYALVSATMAAFLTPFMGSSINLAIPAIGEEFQTSAVLLSWVVSSYLLASAAFLVPMGRLADMIGRKKVFISGIFLFALFSFLSGLARNIQTFLLFRVLQGAGSAMIFGTNMAILTSVFPPQERGKALGINSASVYLGLSLGPVWGGFLNHRFGWHSIFFFCALLALIAFFVILFKLPGEWIGAGQEKYDGTGAVLYMLGLIGFMYGLSSFTSAGWGPYVLVAGILVLAVFIYYETKAPYPLMNLKLFKSNIAFTFSNLAAFINYSATFAATFLLSLYLQSVRGYDSQVAGLILLAQPVVMAALSPVAGSISDRVEPGKVASLGMAITTVSLFVFWFLGPNTSIPLVMANLLLMGAGFGLFSSPNTNAVMSSVKREVYGLASSTLGTMRLVGQSVSMAIVTLMMTLFIGHVELEYASQEALVQCTKVSFVVFGVLCLIGVFASLARGNVRAVQKE
ncbi:MAG TPA: MFS transporter [Clostridia bacterium]|nr:MFS transporter [Clostridia bacterium]